MLNHLRIALDHNGAKNEVYINRDGKIGVLSLIEETADTVDSQEEFALDL